MSSDPKFTSTTPTEADDVIGEIAADWVARRDRGLSPQEAKSLEQWKVADPRNAAELGRIDAAWQRLEAIGTVPLLSAMADAVEARAKGRRGVRKVIIFSSGLLAAAAAIALAYIGWWQGPIGSNQVSPMPATVNYKVLASTARRMTLSDGSVVEMNGDSRIESSFNPSERRVRLVQGEASFVVASNPNRPFLVSAGTVVVRAVGTVFDVRLASTRVDVVVTEGKVRLESVVPGTAFNGTGDERATPTLVAGQRATIDTSVTNAAPISIATPAPAEIDEALAWRSTRLVFDQTPLDEVVAAFNRYNSHKLTLGAPVLRNRALSGVFRVDNIEGFIRLLKVSVDVTTERRSDSETVLLPLP